MSRRESSKERIDGIVDEYGEEGLRERYARGDFAGPAETEAKRRLDMIDKESDSGRHHQMVGSARAANRLSFLALVVAVLALLWVIFD